MRLGLILGLLACGMVSSHAGPLRCGVILSAAVVGADESGFLRINGLMPPVDLCGAKEPAPVRTGISLWKDVTEKSPNKPRGWFMLGYEYWKIRDLNGAVAAYTKCLELVRKSTIPDHPQTILAGLTAAGNLAAIYLVYGGENNLRLADQILEETRNRYYWAPDSSIFNNSALVFMRQGDLERAENFLKAAVAQLPQVGALYARLADVQALKGNCEARDKLLAYAMKVDRLGAMESLEAGIDPFGTQPCRKEAINGNP